MRRYLLFTVFISGMTTLASELAAGRLIGNVFGTSNLVWASIIGGAVLLRRVEEVAKRGGQLDFD